MSKYVHFISGLPRSGSTLLSVLLNQNPDVSCAEYSSPVCSMITKTLSIMAEGEYQTEYTEKQKISVLRGILENYHDISSKPKIIIDNNRSWCTKLQTIDYLYPDSKVICCVRDPVWIINSFERIIGKDPILSSKLIPIEYRATLHQRVEYLLSPAGAFGYAWRAMQEAYFGQFASKLIVIDYDDLVSNPLSTMRNLERILSIQPMTYNFDDISHISPKAYDAALGTPGLHKVARTVKPQGHTLILPPDIVARLARGKFWSLGQMNPQNTTVL